MPRYGREDYDQRSPFSDIPDDEPVFVIRGRDLAGPRALRAYAMEASRAGADRAVVLSVERHAAAMEDYQARHGAKVPDLGTPRSGR